ncbi:MAG: hypothetical protein NTY30_01525 [Candidatus Berkelbacteria bacterium]|nr:hypothetical protein [Candidatus Berkelbacteria bacterium]
MKRILIIVGFLLLVVAGAMIWRNLTVWHEINQVAATDQSEWCYLLVGHPLTVLPQLGLWFEPPSLTWSDQDGCWVTMARDRKHAWIVWTDGRTILRMSTRMTFHSWKSLGIPDRGRPTNNSNMTDLARRPPQRVFLFLH